MSTKDSREDDLPSSGVRDANLCAMYGDHDECPFKEVDEQGKILICICSCHLDPDTLP